MKSNHWLLSVACLLINQLHSFFSVVLFRGIVPNVLQVQYVCFFVCILQRKLYVLLSESVFFFCLKKTYTHISVLVQFNIAIYLQICSYEVCFI